MAINEVFPNPTVKEVVFQVRFPNLFYIEQVIPKLQMKIMDRFPESELRFQRQFVFANLGPEGKLEEAPQDMDTATKNWHFESKDKYELNVFQNVLAVSSSFHKTYNNPKEPNRFKDIIEFVVSNFLEVSPIPEFSRVGLRYIDECPLPEKTSDTFHSYYNSILPTERFDISKAENMDSRVVIKQDSCSLSYVESLRNLPDGTYKLILDFDAFSMNIAAKDYLPTTDILHTIIADEYEKTIKKPVIEHMRKEPKSGE